VIIILAKADWKFDYSPLAKADGKSKYYCVISGIRMICTAQENKCQLWLKPNRISIFSSAEADGNTKSRINIAFT